ncbi:hypothetical protein CAEBREN_03487 [Caenorhabditis brenneri]|uniref:DUF38 domain-containing protein n=1 Tax=Caenorhabditis brenneri TaxID=135651 RepID=G0P570_CAEBE|nr:hypothetical protein CAEBREN_03487 [Caenorhabditis brenneri]
MAQFIKYDKKFIPHGILHYYSSGQTCEEAVGSLLRSHEKNPKLFPRVHAQEVEFWYDSFKKENYDLNQIPTVASHTKLENLPVLDQVFHRVNAADQQSLLKTCKQFKHMIEGEKRLFERVEFRMSNNSIMLQVTCGINKKMIRTVYKRKGEGSSIMKDKKKTESEKDFIAAALYDFSKTVEMIHTKVKKLILKYGEHRVEEVDRVRFMTGVSGILSSLKEKLHVEDLEMSCHEPHELESILQTLKPGILTELDFSAYRKEKTGEEGIDDEEEEDEPVFKIRDSQIFKEHLPHFKNLISSSGPVDLKLKDFVNVPRAVTKIAEITPEDVKAHREKLLQSPNFQNHQFFDSRRLRTLDHGDDYKRELVRAMEPYKKMTKEFEKYDEEPMSGSIPYNDGTGDMLTFEVESFKISFNRSTKKDRARRGDYEMAMEDEEDEEKEKKQDEEIEIITID